MTTDPRDIHSEGVAGPGGPYDQGGVILDGRHAVLLDTIDVLQIDDWNGQQGNIMALVLGGRINKTQDRASVAYLFDADGVAAIVTELLGLVSRASQEFQDEVAIAIKSRAEKMP